jgi:hypothetical protein
VPTKSENSPSTGPRLDAPAAGDGTPRLAFQHWVFGKLEDLHFCKSELNGEAVIVCRFAKNDVSMSFKGFKREFNIDDDSADGLMLDQVAKGLKYVKGLCLGDPLPKELVTREASWSLSARHQRIAYQRVSIQLVNWMTGGQAVITDPDELLQLADDPQTKKMINQAFGEAAVKLGLGIDQKQEVVNHVEQLAHELAYIEALRDRFRRVRGMEEKIQALRRLYGRERSILEVADQVARLGERAVAELNELFLEVDAQTGEILSVLRNLSSQIAYIRDKRDELHIKLMAWDDILALWDATVMKPSPEHSELLRQTYQFLAPRYMRVKEWVLMTQLQRNDPDKEVSLMGGGPAKPKKPINVMRW